MGCGLAGLPYVPCVRGTKTLLFFRAGKFWSAAPTNGRSNFEAKCLSEPQLGREVHKMCTGGLGLELRDSFSILPSPRLLRSLSYAFGGWKHMLQGGFGYF